MISRDGNRYVIEGAVTMDTVRAVAEQGARLFDDAEVVVDFGAVEEADSSAVSLMLEWLREARRRGRELKFVNLPASVKSLALLYGVEGLLPAG